jgi:hypothetical protein
MTPLSILLIYFVLSLKTKKSRTNCLVQDFFYAWNNPRIIRV